MLRWLLVLALLFAACGSDKTPQITAKQVTEATTAAVSTPVTTVRATTNPASTAPAATVGPRDVLRTAGKNKTDTDVFTVAGVWQIACRVSGGAGVGVNVLKENGEKVDYFTMEPGDGVSTRRQGGTFYLTLTPFGSSWDCTVTDMPG